MARDCNEPFPITWYLRPEQLEELAPDKESTAKVEELVREGVARLQAATQGQAIITAAQVM
jgi:hypothetical protein